jgi:hypothetical protein
MMSNPYFTIQHDLLTVEELLERVRETLSDKFSAMSIETYLANIDVMVGGVRQLRDEIAKFY